MTAPYWKEFAKATRVKGWREWAAILVPTIGVGAIIAIIFVIVWSLARMIAG